VNINMDIKEEQEKKIIFTPFLSLTLLEILI
jgi:hypothetical protein